MSLTVSRTQVVQHVSVHVHAHTIPMSRFTSIKKAGQPSPSRSIPRSFLALLLLLSTTASPSSSSCRNLLWRLFSLRRLHRRISVLHRLLRHVLDASHGLAQTPQRGGHEARNLCGLCGAVLERHAADGVVCLEDEAAARGPGA